MTGTATISFAGKKYEIVTPLTLGQQEEVHVALIEDDSGGAPGHARHTFVRNRKILAAALSAEHPEIDEKALRDMRATPAEIGAAVTLVLENAGFEIKSRPTKAHMNNESTDAELPQVIREWFPEGKVRTVWDVFTYPPMTELDIGGTVYKLGPLTEARMTTILACSERVRNGTGSEDDKWPFRIIVSLLLSGDPTIDVHYLLKRIMPDHVAAVGGEFFRQTVVRALSAGHMAGRA